MNYSITTLPDPHAARRSRRRKTGLIVGATALGLVGLLGTGGTALAVGQAVVAQATSGSSTTAIVEPGTTTTGPGSSFGQVAPYGGGTGSSNGYGYNSGSGSGSSGFGYGSGSGTGSASTQTDAVAASAEQTAGVVTIVSDLSYQGGQAAGTGIVLTSDGLILTNNHVIEGSTAVEVTDEETGESYSATVVGVDPTNDIAVLQLADASGLSTKPLATDSAAAAVGDAVTAVGNAEGTGDLVAASGTVTALQQSITTQSESGVSSEDLTGLIQVDADIVSGDSGGPLLNADGAVVGIDTAASSGSAEITGFAIPISTALEIASQIVAGDESGTVQIGASGFLGIGLAQSTATATGSAAGALVAGVYENTPAAEAGLVAGDTITAVNGTAVASGTALSAAIAQMEPGESVTLGWTTAAGAAQSATVTLIAGPAA
ncbi:trypsin-like peptidase domain-containing protein [Herbiconiux sp.]|uniref:S1C family serine protease n=1 Tax=Herbiconiux sp. TaxID=1871186 RepID=UPI0025B85F91|nr:trypsin-like peptidase domain-containing protein [Herbiconiux sp.]